MNFSYSAVWDDTVALTRRHAPLLAAIAGVFIFLPALLLGVFLKYEPPRTDDVRQAFEMFMQWYEAAAPWILLNGLLVMIGSAAMLRLVFAERTTVGGALVFGFMLLPFYFVMSLITGLMLVVGFLLLIVPGFYLFGRVAPAGAIMVAEQRRGPINAISRSFELTRDKGWAIIGLVLIVVVVGFVSVGVADMLLGSIFHLALGHDLGDLLTTIVSTALSAGFSTLIVMLYAAIYRALAPQVSATVFR